MLSGVASLSAISFLNDLLVDRVDASICAWHRVCSAFQHHLAGGSSSDAQSHETSKVIMYIYLANSRGFLNLGIGDLLGQVVQVEHLREGAGHLYRSDKRASAQKVAYALHVPACMP